MNIVTENAMALHESLEKFLSTSRKPPSTYITAQTSIVENSNNKSFTRTEKMKTREAFLQSPTMMTTKKRGHTPTIPTEEKKIETTTNEKDEKKKKDFKIANTQTSKTEIEGKNNADRNRYHK